MLRRNKDNGQLRALLGLSKAADHCHEATGGVVLDDLCGNASFRPG